MLRKHSCTRITRIWAIWLSHTDYIFTLFKFPYEFLSFLEHFVLLAVSLQKLLRFVTSETVQIWNWNDCRIRTGKVCAQLQNSSMHGSSRQKLSFSKFMIWSRELKVFWWSKFIVALKGHFPRYENNFLQIQSITLILSAVYKKSGVSE